jgi:polyhydroxyalkanoate synthesis regulator phasin
MDEQQQRQVNEAAEKFADAVRESYQTVADRAVSAQELNAELTQNFFNNVINNLRSQADQNREMTQQLADQQERQREATQALAQESVGAYMDFINSMFSYYQGGLEETKRQAQ